jgi:ABC-type sugar transport system ATPase subunit
VDVELPQSELACALVCAASVRPGLVSVAGAAVRFRSPADARRRGLGLVTEERAEASFPFLSIRENVTSASWDVGAPGGWLRPGREASLASRIVEMLRIRTRSIEEPLSRLSGGNQQKVVVGRWLLRDVPILILDAPTSGIDVGAKDELYHLVAGMTAAGTSVIMTSSELPELLALSDRILVLHHGRVAAIVEGDTLTESNVIRLAVSGAPGNGTAVQPPVATGLLGG